MLCYFKPFSWGTAQCFWIEPIFGLELNLGRMCYKNWVRVCNLLQTASTPKQKALKTSSSIRTAGDPMQVWMSVKMSLILQQTWTYRICQPWQWRAKDVMLGVEHSVLISLCEIKFQSWTSRSFKTALLSKSNAAACKLWQQTTSVILSSCAGYQIWHRRYAHLNISRIVIIVHNTDQNAWVLSNI